MEVVSTSMPWIVTHVEGCTVFSVFYNGMLCLATSSEPEVGHVDLV